MRISPETEKRIEELLKELTLEEKVSLCHGNSKFYVAAVERLGIGELAMSDGPHGVRAEVARDEWKSLGRKEDECTYLPTGTALAATFNPALGERFGHVLGAEARARGKDIILGPGVNIIRTPLCGRNFEYMSEDPCLIEKMAPGLVKAIEEEDVAACVKHYALNNQELNRTGTNADVSRRALHEIYLRGFYAAIIEGGASSVMGAYNLFENQHCCHHAYLVNEVLKKRWGFEGVFLTDWAGCHDTEEAIFCGLDIEMGTNKPYNEYYLADPFLARAKESEEVREILDDKVRRILRLMFSVGKMDGETRSRGAFNTKEHQQTTYDIAAEAMVLLKNEDDILPVKSKKVLVVGRNATVRHAAGGNSSGIQALYETTPLEGIKRAFGEENVDYESGNVELPYQPIQNHILEIVETKAGIHGYKLTTARGEESTLEYVDVATLENADADTYTYEGTIRVPEDGIFRFQVKSTVGFELYMGGKRVRNHPTTPWMARAGRIQAVEYADKYTADEFVDVKIIVHNEEIHKATFDFGWIMPSEAAEAGIDELMRKAKTADVIIYCAALGHQFDTESYDRKTMTLPAEQDLMIGELADINKNVVVTITAGSPVTMPWLDKVKAVLWGWYAGMEGGNVLGDILVGKLVPSGKMPFTLPRQYADHPVARYGEYRPDNCKYNEDILVGYRAFDYDNIEPMFAFGHGLSYARFAYSDLDMSVDGETVTVTFKVKNIGDVTAKETAQLYVGDPECSVKRAIKELRGFEKVELAPGEQKKIALTLTPMDLSFFDEATETFVVEKGRFNVYVGASSRDIRLEGSFII